MSALDEKLINYGGLAHFQDRLLDDSAKSEKSTWSSEKIDSEISALAGTMNSELEGKEAVDFTFVNALPQEGEEDQYVIIKGENADSLYKYASGAWAEQTPDATKLYFDTEHEALYSYVTADHQFAQVSMVNTYVVGSNLNSNAALKALKTPGVYSVVQRLHSSTKGDYIKNWTLYVESVDYEEYDRSDSVYQRLVSNYTIQKRTWSATRATNDGWSNFSTYYAGEIKDTTTSKYYTWSSNKLSSELAAKQDVISDLESIRSGAALGATALQAVPAEYVTDTELSAALAAKQDVISDLATIRSGAALGATALQAVPAEYVTETEMEAAIAAIPQLEAGQNIEIADNKIAALGYKTPKDVEFSVDNGYFGGGFSEFSIHNPIESASMYFLQTLPASMLPVTIKLSGAVGATSYVVNQDAWAFISQEGQMLIGYIFNTDKGSAKVSGIDASTTSIVFESTINSSEELVEEEVVSLAIQNHIYISGSANTTTYSVSDDLGAVGGFLGFISSGCEFGAYAKINIDGYGVRMIVSANRQDGTITLMETLDKNNPIDNVEVLSFADDYYTYDNLAISYNSHAEGFSTSAGGEIFINPITYDSSTRKLTTTQDLSQFLDASGALKVFLPNNKSKVISINFIKDLGGGVYQLAPQNSVDLGDGTYYGILNYGQFAHAEGSFTRASGDASHAEGGYTTASGTDSHAEGGTTTASGDFSHAEGNENTAQNRSEHAEGSYNVSHKLIDYDWTVLESMTSPGNTRHSIGIGYDLKGRPNVTVHKNAVEVMQNGDMYVLGVGGYQGTDTKVQDATIKTLQEYITALETRIATLETQIANVASNSEINQMFNANAQA